MRKIIEDRLVNFASLVISMRENRERSDISDHLFGQVMRSVMHDALDECDQLIAIFHKTALTLKKKD